jgi:hypothetical protein
MQWNFLEDKEKEDYKREKERIHAERKNSFLNFPGLL